MANLSITQAWNETADFLRREAGLLFPISFLLVSLPDALLEAASPAPAVPGQTVEVGLWLLLFPVVIVVSMIGYVAISTLALRPGGSVGEALRRGATRMPSVVGAAVVLGIAFAILCLATGIVAVLVVPGAMASAQSGAPTPAMVTAVLLMLVAIVPVGLYFGARLMLMTPIAAAESGGPFALIARSWRLTDGHVWKLIGFLVLIGLLVGILTGAIRMVFGILFALVAGPLEPGSTSAWLVIVVMSLVNMVVGAYLASMVARIYAQLAGTDTPQVFA